MYLKNLKRFNIFKNFGKGIYRDIKNRLIPYYASDIRDSWNYRIIPSTIFIFFTNVLPAIAFAQDMFDKTDNAYGINEILLSSAIGGLVFGIFSGQPLCIVGVTGPISIFNYTMYDIVKNNLRCNFFAFMTWIGIWAFVFHILIAFFNFVKYLKFITRYSCNVFGLFINCIYVQKGIQILTRQFHEADYYSSGFYSVMISLLMFIFGMSCDYVIGAHSKFFNAVIRKFFSDYGTPLAVIFFTGFIHFNKVTLNINHIQTLDTYKSFKPTSHVLRNGWFIYFWKDISVSDIFIALPFGLLLTILFYFDHNVSSLICQDLRFKLKKPPSFHYDFLLLGVTTFVTGLIGIPFPNGLIPQAPLHTISLCYYEKKSSKLSSELLGFYKMKLQGVVEQRFTNTVQGLLTLGLMSGPLLVVLGLIPQAVLAGLFFIMGVTGLLNNEIVHKIQYIFTDKSLVHVQMVDEDIDSKNDEEIDRGLYEKEEEPHDQIAAKEINFFLRLKKKRSFFIFLFFELAAFGFEFGVCQGDKAAIAFPLVLLFFAFVATVFFPMIFAPEDLTLLDGAVGSDVLLKSLDVTPAT